MTEAFLKQMAGDRFKVESAGLEPGSFYLTKLNNEV
jgi:protein-tyrosine-phosphatase